MTARSLEAPQLFVDNHVIQLIKTSMIIYMTMAIIYALHALLSVCEASYDHNSGSKNGRSIKSYIQVARIFITLLATIVIVSLVANRSPWAILTGLGAAAAVLMLLFS